MALVDGIFSALLATFLYLVPAGSLHLLVSGLGNPRVEGWVPTEEAAQWKQRYRHGAYWALRVNLLLFGVFLVHALSLVVLAAHDCQSQVSHLTAAARNLANAADVAFAIGFAVFALLAVAAIPWAGLYWSRARRAGWTDPRQRDYFIVHLVFVPLALLLLYVAFGVVPGMVCKTLA